MILKRCGSGLVMNLNDKSSKPSVGLPPESAFSLKNRKDRWGEKSSDKVKLYCCVILLHSWLTPSPKVHSKTQSSLLSEQRAALHLWLANGHPPPHPPSPHLPELKHTQIKCTLITSQFINSISAGLSVACLPSVYMHLTHSLLHSIRL